MPEFRSAMVCRGNISVPLPLRQRYSWKEPSRWQLCKRVLIKSLSIETHGQETKSF